MNDAVRRADLVVLATPVGAMPRIARRIAPYVPKGCIVTDVGSVKAPVVAALESVFREAVRVVGAHPMAGSECSGVAHADEHLFQGAFCIVTRTARTEPSALRSVAALWRRIGCRVRILSPERHDRVAASISHLPHLASAGTVVAAERGALPYAASGFRDVTRLSAGDPEMWADIALANRRWLSKSLSRFLRQMERISRAVSDGDRRRVLGCLRRAQQSRAGLSA